MNELKKNKEKLRVYQIKGFYYPSVTAILSFVFGVPSGMLDWAGRIAVLRALREQRAAKKEKRKLLQDDLVKLALTERSELLKASQFKGVQTHTWIEEFLGDNKSPTEVSKELKGYWDAFQRFYSYFPIEPILQEQVVFSHQYKFAGRMDCLARLNNKNVLIDFKTSNYLRSEYGLQLAAYKFALESMGYQVDECYILHLQSKGFYEFVKYEDTFEEFLNVRKTFDWKAVREKPEFELAVSPQSFIKKIPA